MQKTLILGSQQNPQDSCSSSLMQVLKISLLVLGTYGLMVAMFALWYVDFYLVWPFKTLEIRTISLKLI